MARDAFPVVVHVLLLRGSGPQRELFLLRRAGTGFMDGYHVPPGGHLVAGESVRDAAARECREECGVTPATLDPWCVMPYRSGAHQGFNFVFRGRDWPHPPRLAEPEASDLADWFEVAALPERVAPWLQEALALGAQGEWFRELYWP